MKVLYICDYESQILGLLSISQSGELVLRIDNPDYEAELNEVVNRLQGGPLPLRTNKQIFLYDRLRIDTHLRNLLPEDPDYLWAVKDYLFYHSIRDTRLLGRVIEKESSESSGILNWRIS